MRYLKTYEGKSEIDEYKKEIIDILKKFNLEYIELNKDDCPYITIIREKDTPINYFVYSVGYKGNKTWYEIMDDDGNMSEEIMEHTDEYSLYDILSHLETKTLQDLFWTAVSNSNYSFLNMIFVNNKDKIDLSNLYDNNDIIDIFNEIEEHTYSNNSPEYNILEDKDVQEWIIENRQDELDWLFSKVKPNKDIDKKYGHIINSIELGLL